MAAHRLLTALRGAGADAQMLVRHKTTADPCVHTVEPGWRHRWADRRERAGIASGTGRKNMFKADCACVGLDLAAHPLVEQADTVILGWTNQGFLSLEHTAQLLRGKRAIQVMHDMWPMTGICHHAGVCRGYTGSCSPCPMLYLHRGLAARTLERKRRLYDGSDLRFVAVSEWLADKARSSALLRGRDVSVIGNIVPVPRFRGRVYMPGGHLRLSLAAARIDDPVKGWDLLMPLLRGLRAAMPERYISLTLAGTVKGSRARRQLCELERYCTLHLPGAMDHAQLAQLYGATDILLSLSSYETFGLTVAEGMAHGAVPVALDSGGVRDIVTDAALGSLVERGADPVGGLVEGVRHALSLMDDAALAPRLYRSVADRFAGSVIASKFLEL